MTDRAETTTWFMAVAVLGGLYVWGALSGTSDGFGVNALRTAPRWLLLLLLVGVPAIAVLMNLASPRAALMSRLNRSPIVAGVIAVVAGPLLVVGRSRFINPDGLSFAPKFLADVPLHGAHVTHDEMLELYVHSRFWYYTHARWGWSVEWSYQVLSCLAGVAFVYAMVRLALRLAPQAPWLLLAGALAGGYVQLFFGDVENYTITAALVAFYLLAAMRFLAGEAPLWMPTVVLSVAILFHLVAGWLLPSLWYLAMLSRMRHGDRREWGVSFVLAGGLAMTVLVYLHFHGLPIQRLVSSHAARALRVNDYTYFVWPAIGNAGAVYYRDQLNLVLLLCPAVVMLVPLIAWRRLPLDESGRFLLIAAGSMLLFQGVWKAQLGVYNDWNLYAVGAFVLSIAVWRAVVLAATTTGRRAAACALASMAAVHTGAWILSNHLYGP